MIPTTWPRFYPILDVATIERRGLAVDAAAHEILDAGASILQYRHKGAFTRARFAELERIHDLCRQAGALLVVNDRADIARMLAERGGERAGVHLGQEDLRPREVRALVGEAAIGWSTHNEAQIREALDEPADYFAFGPIFGTRSKENPDPVVGLDGLRRARVLLAKPLVAIGGITRANALRVMQAGADSLAVIGDLYAGPDIRATAQEWLDILKDSY